MLCKMFKLFALLYLVLCVASMSGGMAQAAPTNTGEPAPVQVVRRVPLRLSRKPASKKTPDGEGDYIDRVFVERKTHRVLVQVRHKSEQTHDFDPDKFYWIKQGLVSRCFDWSYQTRGSNALMELIAADLNAGLLYYVSASGIGNGAFLHTINRYGRDDVSHENPGHLICLANGAKPGRAYWSLNDYYKDIALSGWIGVFQDGQQIERIDVGDTPYQLLYSALEDKPVMLRQDGWQLLGGKAHPYPHTALMPQIPGSAVEWGNDIRLFSGASDLDAAGQYLYYADRYGYTLYKIRIKDGVTLEARKLPFVVSALAVDSDSNLIHLVDWKNNSVVTVKLF